MSTTRRFLYLSGFVLVTIGIYLNWSGTFRGLWFVLAGILPLGLTEPRRPPRPFLPRSTAGWILAAGIVVLGTAGTLYTQRMENPEKLYPLRSNWTTTEAFVVWAVLAAALAVSYYRESSQAKAAASVPGSRLENEAGRTADDADLRR